MDVSAAAVSGRSAVVFAIPRRRPSVVKEESGATSSTPSHNFISPRREGEQLIMAPSNVSLGEKKRQRQDGAGSAGPPGSAPSGYIGGAGRGMIGCPSPLKTPRGYAAVPMHRDAPVPGRCFSVSSLISTPTRKKLNRTKLRDEASSSRAVEHDFACVGGVKPSRATLSRAQRNLGAVPDSPQPFICI